MVQDELTLREVTNNAATVIAAVGALVLLLAFVAELIRRHNAQSPLVVLADRLLPSTSHRVAVGVLTLLSTLAAFVGPSAASADSSVRDWLTPPGTTATAPPAPPVPEPTPGSDAAPSAVPPPAPTVAPDPSTPKPAPTPSPGPAPRSVRTWLDHRPVATTPASQAGTAASRTKREPVSRSADTNNPRPSSVVHGRGAGRAASATAPPLAIAAPAEIAAPTTLTATPPYVVLPGDCLWNIAARILGPTASDRAIDRGWRSIYEANRAAIGDHPNLINTGLHLTLPQLDRTP